MAINNKNRKLRGTGVSGEPRMSQNLQSQVMGPVQAGWQKQQTEGGFFADLGKALSGFGKALETPGFRQVLGELGASLSQPGSPAQRVGQTFAEINRRQDVQQQTSGALEKLLGGEDITAEDLQGLSPETQTSLVNAVLGKQMQTEELELRRSGQEIQKEQVERMETPEQRATREQSNLVLKAALSGEGVPEPFKAIETDQGIYVFDARSGEITNQLLFPETVDEEGMTPNQVDNQMRQWFKTAMDLAASDPAVTSYGEFIQSPSGQWVYKGEQPEEARKALHKVAQKYLKNFAERGRIPKDFVDMFADESLGLNTRGITRETIDEQIETLRQEYKEGAQTTERYEKYSEKIQELLDRKEEL